MNEVYESILNSIKKMIGVDKDYGAFDIDLIIAINGVFTILNQLGVGPEKEFSITGPDETWGDFFMNNTEVALAKPYIYMKTKLIFDPPNSGVLHEAMERQISEFEWRLAIQVDPAFKSNTDENPGDSENDPPSPAEPVEGTVDHRLLEHRDAEDQHPINAITGLNDTLSKTLTKESFIPIKDVIKIMEG